MRSSWAVLGAMLIATSCGGVPPGTQATGGAGSSAPGATIVSTTSPVGPSTADLTRLVWTALAPAPIAPRTGFAAAWTGTEMVVWGGESLDGTTPLSDGAAYDPALGTWRKMAAGPLLPEASPVVVWTGAQMLVFGQGEAAAYDPTTDQWQPVVPPPGSPAPVTAATWTGTEVIVFRTDRTIASYRPSASAWTSLPPLPAAPGTVAGIDAVQAGDTLLVWSRWAHVQQLGAGATSSTAGIDLAALDPATRTWRGRRHPGQPAGISDPPQWTGDAVFLGAAQTWCGDCKGPPTFGARGLVYRPRSDSYDKLALGPLDTMATKATWTGRSMIQMAFGRIGGAGQGDVNPGDTAAWDAATDTWTRLGTAPDTVTPGSRTFWTGTSLLAYGPNGGARLGP